MSAPTVGAELRADPGLLRQCWDTLVIPGDVHEVRILKSRRGGPCRLYGTTAGYFDNRDAFVQALARVTGADAPAVFMTLNPTDPSLLARACNRLQTGMDTTTADDQIRRRTGLLIDVDPTRAAGISATDEELAAALAKRDAIAAFLREQHGMHPRAITCSGNGGGLVYGIDLANDLESGALVDGCLRGLAALFDDAAVAVDLSVDNAARLTKVIGSVAAKGDHVPALGRVWRIATAAVRPEAPQVGRETLQRLAALAPRPAKTPPTVRFGMSGVRSWTVAELLDRAGIGYEVEQRSYGTTYALDRCLTSPDHLDGAAITELHNGGLAYTCHHNHCADKGWDDIRQALGLDDRPASTLGTATIGAAPEPAPSLDSAPPALRFRTAQQLAASTPAEPAWVAKPWVARGAILELDGKIKRAGKTTLLLGLAEAVVSGGQFLGESVQQTAVVYLTEQSDATFREGLRRAGLLDAEHLHVLCWADARGLGWKVIVAAAVAYAESVGAALLIVDTLPQWAGVAGDGENTSGEALRAMAPLQAAAAKGLAIIIARHERKSGGDVGDSGRGSSAFSGAVDTIVSLRRPAGDAHAGANVRILECLSRFDEVPETLAVELTPTGYVVLGDAPAYARADAERQILERLPVTVEKAKPRDEVIAGTGIKSTLAHEVLAALVERKVAGKVGAGKKGDPFRFYRIHSFALEIEHANESAPRAAAPVGSMNGDARNGTAATSTPIHSFATHPDANESEREPVPDSFASPISKANESIGSTVTLLAPCAVPGCEDGTLPGWGMCADHLEQRRRGQL